jgi:hypothetical protein
VVCSFDMSDSQALAKREEAPSSKHEGAAGAALCMQALQGSLLVRSASNVVDLV